jgi:hypothetical protein
MLHNQVGFTGAQRAEVGTAYLRQFDLDVWPRPMQPAQTCWQEVVNVQG